MDEDERMFDAYLTQAGNNCSHLEEWWEECSQLLTPLVLFGATNLEHVIKLAFDHGIRNAHRPIFQAKLDGYALLQEYKDSEWFREAVRHTLNRDFEASAKIFVDNGISKALCCGGLEPDCMVHAAIRAEIARRN